MKRVSFISLVSLIVLLLFSMNAFSQEVLKVRTAEWPPLYYQDNNENWTGLDVELMRALLKEAGMTPQFRKQPWARGLKDMKDGKTKLMMNLSKTEERSEYMHWIGPVREVPGMALIVKKGNESFPIKNLEDLTNVARNKGKFGYQRGAHYSNEFNKRINDPEFAKYFEIISRAKLNAKKTLAGRILGFFESPLVMKYRIKNHVEYQNLAVHSFRFTREPGSSNVYFGVSKAGVNMKTVNKLQAAFQKCNSNGTFQKINDEWDKKF